MSTLTERGLASPQTRSRREGTIPQVRRPRSVSVWSGFPLYVAVCCFVLAAWVSGSRWFLLPLMLWPLLLRRTR